MKKSISINLSFLTSWNKIKIKINRKRSLINITIMPFQERQWKTYKINFFFFILVCVLQKERDGRKIEQMKFQKNSGNTRKEEFWIYLKKKWTNEISWDIFGYWFYLILPPFAFAPGFLRSLTHSLTFHSLKFNKKMNTLLIRTAHQRRSFASFSSRIEVKYLFHFILFLFRIRSFIYLIN